jgi:hypothetical protein
MEDSKQPQAAPVNKRLLLSTQFEDSRIKLKKFMSTHAAGHIYNTVLLGLSVLSSIQFIYDTYDKHPHSQSSYVNTLIEVIFSTIFLFDWCLNFYVADNKVKHVTSFYSMVDLLTVVPVWVTYNRTCPVLEDIGTFREAVLYAVFALTTTRILRALRVRRCAWLETS